MERPVVRSESPVYVNRRLLTGWLLISVIVLVIMLSHRSDSTQVLGRYSSRYVLTLGTMFGFALLAALALWGERRGWLARVTIKLPQTRPVQAVVIVGSVAAPAAFWYLRPGSQNFPSELFHVYVLALLMSAIIWLLHQTGVAQQTVTRHEQIVLLILVVMMPLVLMAVFVTRVPPLSPNDEANQVDFIWTAAQTGEFFRHLNPVRPDSNLFITSYPLRRWLATTWLDVFGPGLLQLRTFYLVVGWVGLPFIYLTAKRLYGQMAALVSMLIAGTLLLHHNYARPDVLVGVALAAGLYLFFKYRDDATPTKHIMIGFILALGIEGHTGYGIRFAGAVGAIYLWEALRTLMTTRRQSHDTRVLYYALGVAVYLAMFAVSRIIFVTGGDFSIDSTAQAFSDIYTLQNPGGTGFSLLKKINLHIDLYRQYLQFHPLEVLTLFASLLLALLRRTAADRALVIIFALGTAYLIPALAHTTDYIGTYYAIHWMPLTALMIGAAVAQLTGTLPAQLQAEKRDGFHIAGATVIVALVVLVTVDTRDFAERRISFNHLEFATIGQAIDRIVPDEMVIAGDSVYFLGMPRRTTYTGIATLVNVPLDEWRDGSPRLDEWSRFGIRAPQAIIVTVGRNFQPEIDDYIAANGLVAVRCFAHNLYGKQTILYMPEDFLPGDAPAHC